MAVAKITGGGPRRSQGAVRLHAIPDVQAEIAARVGVGQPRVSRWASGEARPSENHRRLLAAEYGIPYESWDSPPNEPAPFDPDTLPALSGAVYSQQTQALYAEVEEMRRRAQFYREAGDYKLHLRLMQAATAMHVLLGRLLGVTLEINKERAARIPAVRQILEDILYELRPYPEALDAVSRKLGA